QLRRLAAAAAYRSANVGGFARVRGRRACRRRRQDDPRRGLSGGEHRRPRRGRRAGNYGDGLVRERADEHGTHTSMSTEVDVVVIGGGLAGLSAALTSARLGRRTALVTGGIVGGQLVSIEKIEGVPGFPDGVPGYDLCPMTQEQAAAAGVE